MRSGFAAALACLLMAASHAAVAGDSHKGPYLQHLGSSSVDLRLELGAPAAVSASLAPACFPTSSKARNRRILTAAYCSESDSVRPWASAQAVATCSGK